MAANIPALGAELPRRGNWITDGITALAFRLSGWRFAGTFPNVPKMVVIIAPHTSNWDFCIGLMAMFGMGMRGTFLGKHTLFRWPVGIVMRWLGGVPVIRSSSHNVVDQTVAYFRTRERMVLALSPEGTRKKLPAWKTGFYYVAKGAGVPIVPVSFDFPNRLITVYAPVMPTEDKEADFRLLASHFAARMAKHPSQY
jgi:1-acyl-sn-glycerol-3-phosphate acyltransferase